MPKQRSLAALVDFGGEADHISLTLSHGLTYNDRTHDYKRHGTTTLFAAFNILNGKVMECCLPRHRGREFVKFLNQLEKEVPPHLEIHLIVDNYSTHKSAEVVRWLKPKKRLRFHVHFTPTSSSWLNQVERWFGLITERMIRPGTFHSVTEEDPWTPES